MREIDLLGLVIFLFPIIDYNNFKFKLREFQQIITFLETRNKVKIDSFSSSFRRGRPKSKSHVVSFQSSKPKTIFFQLIKSTHFMCFTEIEFFDINYTYFALMK